MMRPGNMVRSISKVECGPLRVERPRMMVPARDIADVDETARLRDDFRVEQLAGTVPS